VTGEPAPIDERTSHVDFSGRTVLVVGGAGYVGSVLSRSGIDNDTWDELEEATAWFILQAGAEPTLTNGASQKPTPGR